MPAIDAPTAVLGQTQSGKTWRMFREFERHDGPAIFWDVQFRARELCPDALRVRSVGDVIRTLHDWREGPPPKIVLEIDHYDGLDKLVGFLHATHLKAHYAGHTLPKMALFLDEVSMAADRFADAENPAVILFTRSYGHNLIGVAITQRPALTSRNILGNAWEWFVFSPAPADVLTLERDYRMELPHDGQFVRNPLDHHYFRYRVGQWFRGNANGVEVVDAVPEVSSGPAPDASGTDDEERPEIVPKRGDSEVSEVQKAIQPTEGEGS